ncbi:SAM-dependent methyltransferase [Erythrobacter sp. SG61-1L]|uniref:methionine biosynthesis protein MetW n=1 Tax=Erythrobacter sp. SG61-1L TaxID=1603897 RepID=UPI0006C92E1A|nr:methionine biosynthesis protein MetW [Erythrobacter sp. SG61-1L]KPL69321.1 SAM-dependent methyltransferase [Erythrobacter sp. SG61-1L]
MSRMRPDLEMIARHIPAGARVLDVGCGDGTLMAALRDGRGVDARGLELSPEKVELCVSKGLSAIQGDANRDLAEYPDGAFDYAILSQTLQTSERPDQMLDQLLRVGRQAFVSFPNFAYWRMRLSLLVNGRMPVTPHLPVSWYETENIHHLTIADFRALLVEKGVKTQGCWFFTHDREVGSTGANWWAEHAVFQLSR